MITRDIYRDFYRNPEGPTVEDKIFLVAKRAGFGVAGIALVLSVLDMAGIHSIGNASDFASTSRLKFAAFGDAVRGGVSDISIFSDPTVVRVKIPTATVQKSAPVIAQKTPAPVKPIAAAPTVSSVDKLAAASSQDAMQMAMAQPLPKSTFAPPLRESLQLAAFSPMASAPAELKLDVPVDVSPSMNGVIPLAMVPMPRAAPGAPPPSPAERLGLHKEGKEKDYAKALRCLANAIYFEARSEPIRGQQAVAQVVVNRAFSGFYPNDVCSVVYQNAHRRLACQFTFACDGKSKAINERGHWARANRIARETLEGQIYLPEVAKSTHYHASYVHPNWVREMKKFARYGLHSFYRPYAWGNEGPVWGSAALTARAEAPAKTSHR